MTPGPTRAAFLNLSWDEQKRTDLRKVLDPETESDLTANCIMPGHRDSSASMVIYKNGVWCYGCRTRWWPDQFLRSLADLPITVERGGRQKYAAPTYIPSAVVKTYTNWLWNATGPYSSRQGFLLDRGLTAAHCMTNGIGHTGEAYTIPVYAPLTYGLLSLRYRRDDLMASPDRPKYWGTGGANKAMVYRPGGVFPHIREFGLLLCEGELDALRVRQAGFPAVSLTNGCNAIGEEHLGVLWMLADRNRITVVYDQDEPGREGADRAVEMLRIRGYQVRSARWAVTCGKDATEFIQRYGEDAFYSQLAAAWSK